MKGIEIKKNSVNNSNVNSASKDKEVESSYIILMINRKHQLLKIKEENIKKGILYIIIIL